MSQANGGLADQVRHGSFAAIEKAIRSTQPLDLYANASKELHNGTYLLHQLASRDELPNHCQLIELLVTGLYANHRFDVLSKQDATLGHTVLHQLFRFHAADDDMVKMKQDLILHVLDLLPSKALRAKLIRQKDRKGKELIDYQIPPMLKSVILQLMANEEPNTDIINLNDHQDDWVFITGGADDEASPTNQQDDTISKLVAAIDNQSELPRDTGKEMKLCTEEELLKRAMNQPSGLGGIDVNLMNRVLTNSSLESLIDGLVTEDGRTLLHLAAQNSDVTTIKYLLSLFARDGDNLKNCFIFKQDNVGKSAIHYAAEAEAVYCVSELLHHAGNLDRDLAILADRTGYKPRNYVQNCRETKGLLELVEKGYYWRTCRLPIKCMIFYNDFYDVDTPGWPRDGAKDECETLNTGLRSLGLEPDIYDTWDCVLLQKTLSAQKLTDISCLLVFLMTHGELGGVYDSQRVLISISDILGWMPADLEGSNHVVPMVLVLQRCRDRGRLNDISSSVIGGRHSCGLVSQLSLSSFYSLQQPESSSTLSTTTDGCGGYCVSKSDTCIIDSTVGGSQSIRGLFISCFSRVLADALSRHVTSGDWESSELNHIFTMTNAMANESYNTKQVAVIEHTFKRKLTLRMPVTLHTTAPSSTAVQDTDSSPINSLTLTDSLVSHRTSQSTLKKVVNFFSRNK